MDFIGGDLIDAAGDADFDGGGGNALSKLATFGKNSGKRQEHLLELHDKAAFLADKTGQKPMSWYEYKHVAKPDDPTPVKSFFTGAGIGLLLGTVIAVGITVMSGGITTAVILPIAASTAIGGVTATYSDMKNTPETSLLHHYEDYLKKFESDAVKDNGGSIPEAHAITEYVPGKHAEQVLAQRAAAAAIQKDDPFARV